MLREHRFHFALHEKLVSSTVFTFGLGGWGGWGGLGLGPGLGAWLRRNSLLPATSLRWLAPPARALRQLRNERVQYGEEEKEKTQQRQ